jgi:hypothetical protein
MVNFKNSIVALAFCTSTIFCFAQETKTNICHLGELKKDVQFQSVDSLAVDCSSSRDLARFASNASKFTSLSYLILNNDAGPEEWDELFSEIKINPTIKTLVFDKNTFHSLPYGFEKLDNIEYLVISNNDEIDYFETLPQLAQLSNLNEIDLDIVSIYDVPDSLFLLSSIYKIVLTNKEGIADETDSVENAKHQRQITYDYYLNKGNNSFVSVKYRCYEGEMDSLDYTELMKRFSNSSYYMGSENRGVVSTLVSTQTFVPTYNFINPPIAGIDVLRQNYAVNTDIDNVVFSPSGSKIFIPANAFIDQSGNPVKGDVILKYREFRDPVDILVSGIPMKYKTDSVINDFESAGMFEITACIGQQPLKLAPDKQIKMNFATTSPDSTYNFYAYNDSIGNWEYINRPKKVTDATRINESPMSSAYYNYKELIKSHPTKVLTTSLEDRFKSFDFIYTKRLTNDYLSKGYKYKKNGKTYNKNLTDLVRLSRVKKTKDGKILFKLRYLHQSHPELAGFNNVYFETQENESLLAFRKKFLNKQRYNDIRIHDNGDGVEVQLKAIDYYKTIDARVVTLGEKGEIKDANFLGNKIKCYNRNLKHRGRRFAKVLKRDPQNYVPITDQKELSEYAYSKCKKNLNGFEKKMSKGECIAYFSEMMANEKQVIANSKATSGNLICSLSLDGMGIYNCDQIRRMTNPVEVLANYENSGSNKLIPDLTYIINKKVNGVYQYDGSYGYRPDKIAFSNSKEAENVLITVSNGGKMSVYKTQDFKNNNFSNKSVFTFKVQELENKVNTVAELRKVIGL